LSHVGRDKLRTVQYCYSSSIFRVSVGTQSLTGWYYKGTEERIVGFDTLP